MIELELDTPDPRIQEAWVKADRAERWAKLALIIVGLVTLFYVAIPALHLAGILKTADRTEAPSSP